MSKSTFLYGQYQEAERELVKKIKQIGSGLDLLTQLIAHGQLVAPVSGQDLVAYSTEVKKQIEALTILIKGVESRISHEDLSMLVDQFHEDAQAVLSQLGVMDKLPNLEVEKAALQEHLEDFELLEEGLENNPSRPQVLKALHEAKDLLGGINTTLETALNNPLVNIARCSLEGAQAMVKLTPRPEIS